MFSKLRLKQQFHTESLGHLLTVSRPPAYKEEVLVDMRAPPIMNR